MLTETSSTLLLKKLDRVLLPVIDMGVGEITRSRI